MTVSVSSHSTADDQGRFQFHVSPAPLEYQFDTYRDGARANAHLKMADGGAEYTRYRYDRSELISDRTEETHTVPDGGIEIELHLADSDRPRPLVGRAV